MRKRPSGSSPTKVGLVLGLGVVLFIVGGLAATLLFVRAPLTTQATPTPPAGAMKGWVRADGSEDLAKRPPCDKIGTPSGEDLQYEDGTPVCLPWEEMQNMPDLVRNPGKGETRRVERDWRGRTVEIVDMGGQGIDYKDVAEWERRKGKKIKPVEAVQVR